MNKAKLTALCHKVSKEVGLSFNAVMLPLDIATGDVVTPHPIDYKYVSSFGEEIIIKDYPIETMLEEKLLVIEKQNLI